MLLYRASSAVVDFPRRDRILRPRTHISLRDNDLLIIYHMDFAFTYIIFIRKTANLELLRLALGKDKGDRRIYWRSLGV